MTRRRVLFIVNPTAGGGKSRRSLAKVRSVADAAGLDHQWVLTTRPNDAEIAARSAAAGGYDAVIGVGGDGTLQEIVNGLLAGGRPPPLGVVSCGTGNDFARTLRLPLDPVEAAKVACGGRPVAVDVARCNQRYFINIAGAGLDAEVAAEVARGRHAGSPGGPVSYLLAGMRALGRFVPRDLTIDLDGRRLEQRSLLVAIGNGPVGGGGMRFCPAADPRDGLLDVCIIGEVSKWRAVSLLPALFSGTYVSHPAVSCHRVAQVRIEERQKPPIGTRVHLDGEPRARLPIDVRVVPGALSVLVD